MSRHKAALVLVARSELSFGALVALELALLRKAAHIPQGGFAQSLGFTQCTWSRYETGRAALTIDLLWSACALLKVEPDVVVRSAAARVARE